MNDLKDDSQKVAEDIIDQTRLGFREEATKRIVSILDYLHQLQNKIADFKKQKEEEKFSSARELIHGWLKEKRKRVSFETLRKDLDEPSYTDAFLKKLLNKYPKLFPNTLIKTSKGKKRGITLRNDESRDKSPKKLKKS